MIHEIIVIERIFMMVLISNISFFFRDRKNNYTYAIASQKSFWFYFYIINYKKNYSFLFQITSFRSIVLFSNSLFYFNHEIKID